MPTPTTTAIAFASATPTRIVGVARSGAAIVLVDAKGHQHRCSDASKVWHTLLAILGDPSIEDVGVVHEGETQQDKEARMSQAFEAILQAGRAHMQQRLGTPLADAVTAIGGEALGSAAGFLGRLSTRGGSTVGKSRRR